MKIAKSQIIILLFISLALAGLGCKKADNANKNINSAAVNNKNIAINGSNTNISNTNASIGGQENANTANPQQANAISRGKSDVEKIARFFTEFFGSFSTDSNYSNVTGLKIYMTQSMQKWADGFTADAKKNKKKSKRKRLIGGRKREEGER